MIAIMVLQGMVVWESEELVTLNLTLKLTLTFVFRLDLGGSETIVERWGQGVCGGSVEYSRLYH